MAGALSVQWAGRADNRDGGIWRAWSRRGNVNS